MKLLRFLIPLVSVWFVSLLSHAQNADEITATKNDIKSENRITYSDPAGKQWKKGGYYDGYTPQQEVLTKRSRTSKHFDNGDGTFSLITGVVQHYLDENGLWQDISKDIELGSSPENPEYAYSNTKNEIKTYYPQIPGQGIKIVKDDIEFNVWKQPALRYYDTNNNVISLPVNQSQPEVELSDGIITYNNLYSGMREKFKVINDGIKSELIINSLQDLTIPQQADQLSFSQFIPVPEGYEVFVGDEIKDTDFSSPFFTIANKLDKEKAISMHPVFSYDTKVDQKKAKVLAGIKHSIEAGEKSEADVRSKMPHEDWLLLENSVINSNYFVGFVQGGITVSYSLPAQWLKDENRVFPVVVDPTFTLGAYAGGVWTRLPYDIYYNYSRSQQILLNSELNFSGTISRFQFWCDGWSADDLGSSQQWLNDVAYATYSSATWQTEGTLVYGSSTLNIAASNTWQGPVFVTNFAHNNANHLQFTFRHQDGSYENSYSDYEYGSATSRMLAGSSDGTNPPGIAIVNYVNLCLITYTTTATTLPQVPSVSVTPTTVCSGGAVTVTASGMAPGGQGSNSSGVANISGGSYINVANNAALQSLGEFTYEMWVYPTSFTANNTYFENGSWGGQTLILRQDAPGFMWIHMNGTTQRKISYAPPLNQWTHLALVRTSNGTITMYENGNAVGTFVVGYTTTINNTTQPLRIGSSVHTTGQFFNGAIDEFRLFNVAVSPANIKAWMSRELTSSHPNWANVRCEYRFNGNLNNSSGTASNGTASGTVTYSAANFYTYTWTGSGAPSGSTNEVQTANPTSNGTFTVIASRSGYTNSPASAATASVSILPAPQGSLTSTGFCGDGNGTGQLIWTATAGTGNYTVNYSSTSENFNPNAQTATQTNVVSGTGFNASPQPVQTTTYTLTSVTGSNGCTRTSGFTGGSTNLTVTPPAPVYTLSTTTITGLGTAYTPSYPPAAGTAPGWGTSSGQIIDYTTTTWPTCANWGIAGLGINAGSSSCAAPIYNMKLSLQAFSDGQVTNLSIGRAFFFGTSTFYFMRSGSMVNEVLNIRARIFVTRTPPNTATTIPIQYVPGNTTANLLVKANQDFRVTIYYEVQVPSPAPQFGGYTAGSWVPAVTFFNVVHPPSSSNGSIICSSFNSNWYTFTGLATAVSATAPTSVCLGYSSGGVPNGGPVNLTGDPGSFNNSPCTAANLNHRWTSTASPLINTTVEDPTPIINQADAADLTTYTYTVSSGSDRVCYGTATTGTPTANTTSPTTWLSSTTAGADNWYNHANWSNCVPCNNTSPACAKQAVIATSNNYPNISTGTAKATSVLHNATPNKITITPGATLKLITP